MNIFQKVGPIKSGESVTVGSSGGDICKHLGISLSRGVPLSYLKRSSDADEREYFSSVDDGVWNYLSEPSDVTITDGSANSSSVSIKIGVTGMIEYHDVHLVMPLKVTFNRDVPDDAVVDILYDDVQ